MFGLGSEKNGPSFTLWVTFPRSNPLSYILLSCFLLIFSAFSFSPLPQCCSMVQHLLLWSLSSKQWQNKTLDFFRHQIWVLQRSELSLLSVGFIFFFSIWELLYFLRSLFWWQDLPRSPLKFKQDVKPHTLKSFVMHVPMQDPCRTEQCQVQPPLCSHRSLEGTSEKWCLHWRYHRQCYRVIVASGINYGLQN